MTVGEMAWREYLQALVVSQIAEKDHTDALGRLQEAGTKLVFARRAWEEFRGLAKPEEVARIVAVTRSS